MPQQLFPLKLTPIICESNYCTKCNIQVIINSCEIHQQFQNPWTSKLSFCSMFCLKSFLGPFCVIVRSLVVILTKTSWCQSCPINPLVGVRSPRVLITKSFESPEHRNHRESLQFVGRKSSQRDLTSVVIKCHPGQTCYDSARVSVTLICIWKLPWN